MSDRPTTVELASCSVDLVQEVVRYKQDIERKISTRESALLAYLAARPRQDISRDELLREVWGYSGKVLSRAADTTVKRLREKIEADPTNPRHLITVFGHGYRFEPLHSPMPAPPRVNAPVAPLTLGAVRVDFTQQVVVRPTGTAMLTTIEARLLEYLASRKGAVADRAELRRKVWEGGGSKRVVDSAVRRLRAKIELDPSDPTYLLTVRGRGYRLQIPHRAGPTNLMPALDAFVGRDKDHEVALERLQSPGLATLVGPAGIGKTRLAHQLGRDYAASGNQAWFCDLSNAKTMAELTAIVARVLGVASDQHIGQALAGRAEVLLILDNFEHLIEHATLLDDWRAQAPEARFLATSREPLRLRGERVVRLDVLPADDAVFLLVCRAADLGRDVSSDPDLERLARQLDGLPLALELAASRLTALAAAEILDRLDLSLLSDRRRDRPTRHATLRAALAWSWDLLSDAEQSALAQLSVFRGGLDMRAAEAVLELEGEPIVLTLESLVDKSLLAFREGRLFLLETVLAFAADKLTARPAAQVRHANYFASMGSSESLRALEAASGIGPRRALLQELDNLVAAVRNAVAQGRGAVASDACRAAWAVIGSTGQISLGVSLSQSVVDLPDLSDLVRARATLTRGRALTKAGQTDAASASLEEALRLAQVAAVPDTEAEVRVALGRLAMSTGSVSEAHDHYLTALDLHRRTEDLRGQASALAGLGTVYRGRGELEPARAAYEEALSCLRDSGSRGEAGIWLHLGELHRDAGLTDQASTCFERALRIYRRYADRQSEAVVLLNLGKLAGASAMAEEARSYLCAALQIQTECGNPRMAAIVLSCLGTVSMEQGKNAAARSELEEALRRLRQVSDRKYEAIVLGNLGLMARRAGRLDEAERQMRSALALHQEHGELAWVGIALGRLGGLALNRGDAPTAIDYLVRATTLLENRHARAHAMYLATLGQARKPLGIEELRRAADLMQAGGWDRDRVETLCALAKAGTAAGEAAMAKDALDQAAKVADALGTSLDARLHQLIADTLAASQRAMG